MDFFYDGQVRRYLTQFINFFSNFSYRDSKGKLYQVPVRYGDFTKQVSQIINGNSENKIPSAPFISCYIKDLQFDRARLQDPTFVSKIHVRERDFDSNSNTYLNTQGANYTIERIMPTPYTLTLSADIWTTNTEQKLQLWEQMVVFFTPSFEIQTTDNYIDWTSLSVIELDGQIWSSRTIPQGTNEDIDILSMSFKAPIWITPPAKVKKLGIVTKIISNIFSVSPHGTIEGVYNKDGITEAFSDISPDTTITVTPGNYDLLVLNNTAKLIKSNGKGEDIDLTDQNNTASWLKLLDLYPGKFTAGLSQLRFNQPNGDEVIATISLDPSDETSMILNVDTDTVPSNTIISGRGTVDAVINPQTYSPGTPTTGLRYLILEDININDQFGTPDYDGPDGWKGLGLDYQAHANDIIEFNGSSWIIVFDSQNVSDIVYITNSYTGTQYKWDQGTWSKTYEGVYSQDLWRLIL